MRVGSGRVGSVLDLDKIEFLPVGTVVLSEHGPLLSTGEIAAALALSGGRLRRGPMREPGAAKVAALVLAGLDRGGGLSRLQRRAALAREADMADLDGRATPAQLATLRALWGSDARAQRCVDVTFCLVDATDDGVLDLPRPRIDAHGAGRGMTVGYATALGRLGAASEDEITAALYRSPDYGHHGPVVLDLAETFAAIELDHGLTRPNLTTALTHGDRARLRACRAAARVVIATR